jgi:hypothetical protein
VTEAELAKLALQQSTVYQELASEALRSKEAKLYSGKI